MLDPADYDAWLGCEVADAASFFRPWRGERLAEPAPLLRAPRAGSAKVMRPPSAPPADSLF